MLLRKLLKIMCWLLIVFLTFYPVITHAQVIITNPEISVDVESGYPIFKETDKDTIKSCTLQFLTDSFPFDQVFIDEADLLDWYTSLPSSECPQITFWGYDYELCYLVDIYHAVEPLLLASLMYAAIIAL